MEEPMEIEEDTVPNPQIIENTPVVPKGTLPVSQMPENPTEDPPLPASSTPEDVVVIDTEDSDDSSKTPKPANAEPDTPVVVLDDDECTVIDLVAKKQKTANTRCINYACTSGEDMMSAPLFCLSFFRVKSSGKKHKEICHECYMIAVKHYEDLAAIASRGGNLFDFNFPLRHDLVEIDDSDSEEEGSEVTEECFDAESVEFLKENFDQVFQETLKKYEFEGQLDNGLSFLRTKRTSVAESFREVDEMVKDLRKRLDNVQFTLYDQFKTKYKELRPIEIISDKALQNSLQSRQQNVYVDRNVSRSLVKPGDNQTSHLVSSQTVNAAPVVNEVPKELPPIGPVVKQPLVIGAYYYASRYMTRGSWLLVKLSAIVTAGSKYDDRIAAETIYKVTLENKDQKQRYATGRELAYANPSKTRLEVGARVIAAYKDLVTTVTPESPRRRKEAFFPGIVGEPPCPSSKYRYMIFFDDGYAQYVPYNSVFLILDASKDVWDDIYYENRSFIRKYLQAYPERSMVKLNKGQTVSTEYKGKWWLSTVLDIDCSLVQVRFESSKRVEWIYRGSSRLSPIYKEEQAASNRIQNRSRVPRVLSNSNAANKADVSAPYVQYSRNDDDVQIVPTEVKAKVGGSEGAAAVPRAVARKSTARPLSAPVSQAAVAAVPFLPFSADRKTQDRQPPSKIVYYTPREQANTHTVYKPHRCSPRCKEFITYNLSKLTGYNPLSKPLLCGWNRVTYKHKVKREIAYKAPCGRFLRNLAEIHQYLVVTASDMTVDLFDFDLWVRCLAEFVLDSDQVLTKDLSQGQEQVPIPVVNYEDDEPLNFYHYSTRREPMEGVNLNLDPEFLCGCDCEDNCEDKSRCACWRLTLEGAQRVQRNLDSQYIGYAHRRLLDQVITGIYECNPRCKCGPTCLNRVVQNPLQMKLQVFKTTNRGWGIRCLNDIPQGAFICIYAGSLLTEQMANEGGQNYGDEYLAELDYIETAEKTKEDYEEEAYEPESEDNAKHRSRTPDDEDEDEDLSGFKEKTGGRRRYVDDEDFVSSCNFKVDSTSIRTRLRPRNVQEEKPTPEKEPEVDKKKAAEDENAVTISDDENDERELTSFNPSGEPDDDKRTLKHRSVREIFGGDEAVYIMDAKNSGNIGRFLNHSCSPNVFVQNVFVDTHDVRFPWVAFFSLQYIRAGTELTWNYNYDIGSVPGKVLYCHCSSAECKGRLL